MARHRLVIIGGDAGGLSAAAQARRLRSAEELDIVVLEQGPEASYSACGIPYWVGDLVPDRDRLIARSPAAFAAPDLDLRPHTPPPPLPRPGPPPAPPPPARGNPPGGGVGCPRPTGSRWATTPSSWPPGG